MNAAVAIPVRTARGFGAALAFAWRAWQSAGRRYFLIAILLAFGMATLKGTGAAVLSSTLAPWRAFVSEFVDWLMLSLMLMPCLAVAAAISTDRVPRWLPYIIAPTVSVILTWLIAGSLVVPTIEWLIDDPAQWPGLTMPSLLGFLINWPTNALLVYIASFGFMYARRALQRAAALRGVQLERSRLARETYESRLRTMQARIDPQFLFDTLGEIENLYEVDPALADRALDDLIAYLRAALPRLSSSTSSVAAEFALVRAWLDLMQIRTKGRLTHAFEATDAALEAAIPPMVVLPLVANAVHGIQSSLEAPFAIRLEASTDGEGTRIVLSSDVARLSRFVSTDVAEAVRDRLRALYGDAATIALDEDRPFAARVTIPR